MTKTPNGVELLLDYHRRVRRDLVRLREVEAKVKTRDGESVREAKRDAAEIASYLERMTPAHEQDETESLFPRLIAAMAQAGEQHSELAQEIAHIQGEHEDFQAIWVPLRHWLGMLATPDAIISIEHFSAAVDAIEEHFLHHFELEEATVYVNALRLLDADELKAMAVEMRERRS